MFYVSRTKYLPKLAEVLIAAHINLNDNIRYITFFFVCFFFFFFFVVVFLARLYEVQGELL